MLLCLYLILTVKAIEENHLYKLHMMAGIRGNLSNCWICSHRPDSSKGIHLVPIPINLTTWKTVSLWAKPGIGLSQAPDVKLIYLHSDFKQYKAAHIPVCLEMPQMFYFSKKKNHLALNISEGLWEYPLAQHRQEVYNVTSE